MLWNAIVQKEPIHKGWSCDKKSARKPLMGRNTCSGSRPMKKAGRGGSCLTCWAAWRKPAFPCVSP